MVQYLTFISAGFCGIVSNDFSTVIPFYSVSALRHMTFFANLIKACAHFLNFPINRGNCFLHETQSSIN